MLAPSLRFHRCQPMQLFMPEKRCEAFINKIHANYIEQHFSWATEHWTHVINFISCFANSINCVYSTISQPSWIWFANFLKDAPNFCHSILRARGNAVSAASRKCKRSGRNLHHHHHRHRCRCRHYHRRRCRRHHYNNCSNKIQQQDTNFPLDTNVLCKGVVTQCNSVTFNVLSSYQWHICTTCTAIFHTTADEGEKTEEHVHRRNHHIQYVFTKNIQYLIQYKFSFNFPLLSFLSYLEFEFI